MRSDKLLKALFALPDPREPSPHPEPPRLGILHLMVLTACVAADLGITRAVSLAFSEQNDAGPFYALQMTGRTLLSIGSGAALAGPLFLVVRRRHGLPFPIYPGEHVLVVMGFGVLARWMNLAYIWLTVCPIEPAVISSVLHIFLVVLPLLGCAAIFVWALICMDTRRWQVFLVASAVNWVFLLLLSGGLYALPTLVVTPWFPATIVLVVVVLRDHFDGQRYPWTHWLGVGTRLWLDASVVGCLLWYALFARGGFP